MDWFFVVENDRVLKCRLVCVDQERCLEDIDSGQLLRITECDVHATRSSALSALEDKLLDEVADCGRKILKLQEEALQIAKRADAVHVEHDLYKRIESGIEGGRHVDAVVG